MKEDLDSDMVSGISMKFGELVVVQYSVTCKMINSLNLESLLAGTLEAVC